MTHSVFSHHLVTRLALLVCMLAVMAGGLFYATHGLAAQAFSAAASHAITYVIPPSGWR